MHLVHRSGACLSSPLVLRFARDIRAAIAAPPERFPKVRQPGLRVRIKEFCMRRCAAILALSILFACSGRPSTAPVSPLRPSSPLTGNSPTSFSDLPPAPAIDSALLAADFDAERRQAADSAADEAVLEELADAHPAADEVDDASADEQPES